MKVYCGNCKHFWSLFRGSIFFGEDLCTHPESTTIINEFDRQRKDYKNAWTINKNNDCPLYKRKWYKFWIKEDL